MIRISIDSVVYDVPCIHCLVDTFFTVHLLTNSAAQFNHFSFRVTRVILGISHFSVDMNYKPETNISMCIFCVNSRLLWLQKKSECVLTIFLMFVKEFSLVFVYFAEMS
jgi:uncharacterized protein YjiK